MAEIYHKPAFCRSVNKILTHYYELTLLTKPTIYMHLMVVFMSNTCQCIWLVQFHCTITAS